MNTHGKENEPATLAQLKSQCDWAVGCLVLALATLIALLLSVMGPSSSIDTARASVELHRKLERDSYAVLEENRKALDHIVNVYEATRAARTH